MPDDVEMPEGKQPEQEADTGRDRLVDALRSRPSRAQVVVGVLLFAVGFATVTQVRANEADDDLSGLRQSDLIRAFDALAASTERAESEIDRLSGLRRELQDSTTGRRTALDQARQQEARLRILAGTVATTGPGIRVTIHDDEGTIRAGVLLDLVQELRSSGAEAMEINDRIRIVASTSIEDGPGGGILVGGQLVEGPYVLDAIGEPATLAGALPFPGGPVERVEDAGGRLTHEKQDEVLIESVVDLQGPDFATPEADQ